MTDINVDLDAIGIREVLDDLRFPARRWQVIAQAQYYGAPRACTRELEGLPTRRYKSMREVAVELAERRERTSSEPSFANRL